MIELSTRRVQVAVLLLLSLSAAQVVWWVLDQRSLALHEERSTLERYEADARAAETLFESGVASATILDLYPHLVVASSSEIDARIVVSEEAKSLVVSERRSHVNQYMWEGAFFLLVLFGGIAVLSRTLIREADLQRRQRNFLAAVSHELKSPLASLRLLTETLLLREMSAEERQSLLERELEDVNRLEEMVTNILDASHLEEGRIELRPEEIELRAAVEQAAAAVRGSQQLVSDEGARITVDVPSSLMLRTDPVALGTVLRNLLTNAVKAVAAAGKTDIRIEAANESSSIVLRIEDEGVGFDPREAPRLFERFYRPGDELRRQSSGTGLGLFLVKTFVELDGGSVEARSEGPGRGATFVVRWPRATTPQSSAEVLANA